MSTDAHNKEVAMSKNEISIESLEAQLNALRQERALIELKIENLELRIELEKTKKEANLKTLDAVHAVVMELTDDSQRPERPLSRQEYKDELINWHSKSELMTILKLTYEDVVHHRSSFLELRVDTNRSGWINIYYSEPNRNETNMYYLNWLAVRAGNVGYKTERNCSRIRIFLK